MKRKTIFQSAAKYVKEYQSAERNLIRMRRQARDHGNYFIEPSPKVVFVIRIRGCVILHELLHFRPRLLPSHFLELTSARCCRALTSRCRCSINGVDPKTRKILQLLRLRQINNGVFLRFNKATLNMLRSVNTYVTYGTPNVKAVRELVYKRGFANVKKQRIAITDNSVIQQELGSNGVICTEDIVHSLTTCCKSFGKVSKFLWPFQLNSPSGGFSKKRISFIEGGQYVPQPPPFPVSICNTTLRYGDREAFISQLIHRMI